MRDAVRALISLWMCLVVGSAFAAYPDKPIRLVVQYGVGGSTDVLARLVAHKLGQSLGQTVTVDNRPGANGILAADFVAKADPDGYTLLFNTNGDTANVSLYRKLPYDLERDLAPIVLVGAMPHMIVVHPDVKAKTVAELIALAKLKPGVLNYASVGIGSTPHLAGELFNSMAHVEIVHVPYKSSSQAISDVMGGQIQVMFLGAVSGLPQVKAGKLRVLAVTGEKRLAALADVPAVAETPGLEGYEASTWWGLLAPAHTPDAIVSQLNKAVADVLASTDLVEYLASLGAYPRGGSPADFAAFQKTEIVKWGKIVRESGARLD